MKRLNILLILILTLFIFSCKDSDRDKDTTVNSSIDYAMGQSMTYDIFKLVHQAALSSKGITAANLADTTTLFGCDTLIVDTVSSPMSITIQFNGTCTGDGIDRSGSITATFSSKYDVLGCVVSLSFNNYIYKVYPIGGSISYSYTGLTGTSPTYSYIPNKVTITKSNGYIEFSGNQTLTVSSGESTATVSDDSYTITGTASGRAFQGNNFSAIIDNDLNLLGNCAWISSGIVTVSPENKNPRTLDFGSACDDKASVRIYNLDYEIVIP